MFIDTSEKIFVSMLILAGYDFTKLFSEKDQRLNVKLNSR